MQTADATDLFLALSSAVRLEIFRSLVRHEPTGLVAGEIASLLGVTPANLSFHLKTLSRAGLVYVTAEGRFQRYRARLEMVEALVGFLTHECCHGNPGLCAGLAPAAACVPSAATPRRAPRR